MRLSYIIASIFFILSLVFNAPETDNGLSLVLFCVSLLAGFIGLLHSMEEQEKAHFKH